MSYQKTIRELDPSLTPAQAAGVEGSMRLQSGTLCHLPRATFREEIGIALACEREHPGFMKSIADSYGIREETS